MENISCVKSKNLKRVTKFYKEETQKIELAKKLEIEKKEREDIIENIKTISTDWLGEVPTFQEVGNPFN